MSLQAGRCLLFKSILFNLGVVLSGILSAQILAASVTPFVSKSHIQTLNAGGNQLKKSEAFLVFPRFLRNPQCLKINQKVSFKIASEASYVYILVKNAPKGSILASFGKNSNATFLMIFKHCASYLM